MDFLEYRSNSMTCFNCGTPIDHFIHKNKCLTGKKDHSVIQYFDKNIAFKNMMTHNLRGNYAGLVIGKYNDTYNFVYMIHDSNINIFIQKIKMILKNSKNKDMNTITYLRIPGFWDVKSNFTIEKNNLFLEIEKLSDFYITDRYYPKKKDIFENNLYCRYMYGTLYIFTSDGKLLKI